MNSKLWCDTDVLLVQERAVAAVGTNDALLFPAVKQGEIWHVTHIGMNSSANVSYVYTYIRLGSVDYVMRSGVSVAATLGGALDVNIFVPEGAQVKMVFTNAGASAILYGVLNGWIMRCNKAAQ
jgi:hypothetical protein